MEVDVIFFVGEELNADWRETICFASLLKCLDFCCILSLLFNNFLTLYEMPAFAVSSLSIVTRKVWPSAAGAVDSLICSMELVQDRL